MWWLRAVPLIGQGLSFHICEMDQLDLFISWATLALPSLSVISSRQLISSISLYTQLVAGAYNYINKAPEAETNAKDTDCGITWNQEDNDMLFGFVLYTHINSRNFFKSKGGLQSSNLLLMLINMRNKIIWNVSTFETNTFVFILSTFLFMIFLFYIYFFNKYLSSMSRGSGTGLVLGIVQTKVLDLMACTWQWWRKQ